MSAQADPLTASRWIACQNASSSVAIPGFAPVQVTAIGFYDENVSLTVDQIGSSSNAAFNQRIAFVGPGGVPASGNGFGMCTLDMPCQVLWDTGTPTPGDVWGIKPGQFSLTKGGVGQFVVDGIVDSGTKRMFGRWGGIDTILGKVPSGTFSSGSSGTLNVWIGTPGSESVTSGPWTITAYNRRAAIGTAAFVVAKLINGSWYILDDGTAYVLEGALSGDCFSATSTVTVGSLSAVTPGALPAASTISASNDFALAALAGAKCLVAGNGATWVLIDVARTVQTFVTRVVWTGTELDQYTRDVVGMFNNSEQGPTAIDTATACPS